MEGLERWQNNQVKKMGNRAAWPDFFMIGGMLFVVLRKWADNIFGYTGSAAFLVHFFRI